METVEQASTTIAATDSATTLAAGPRMYELSQRTLFSAPELRRLTADYDTIRRSCAVRLAVLFRADFDLTLESLETPTFRQFVASLAQPTHLTLFKVEPLRGVGVLEIDPVLALTLLDRLMGGPGEGIEAARDLTEIEVALLGQVSQLITEAWCTHWANYRELKSTLVGHENDPHYLQSSAPESPQLIATFTAQIGECSGQIRLALPVGTLDPLLQKIRAELKPPADTQSPIASTPVAQWNPALDLVDIPIHASLPGPQITARQLQNLKVGDVLSFPVEAANQVQLRLNGVSRFEGQLGTRDNHWAVQILKALKS